MIQEWFITGTDTGVGKTQVTIALMRYLQQQGWCVVGMKPIATGCKQTREGLRNSDAQKLLHHSSLTLPYSHINPYAFKPPTSPHLAAQHANQPIEMEKIMRTYHQLARQVDIILVEGIGGWRVPINAHHTLKELVLSLNLPVILVVGLRLGCINHALLTAETIIRDGCQLYGWIANHLSAEISSEVVESLQNLLPAPLLGTVPFQQDNFIFENKSLRVYPT